MLVIHHRGSYTIRQRKYCYPQQRIVFPHNFRNELDKERGVNQVNSYPKPQEGQNTNHSRFEGEFENIHLVVPIFLLSRWHSPPCKVGTASVRLCEPIGEDPLVK